MWFSIEAVYQKTEASFLDILKVFWQIIRFIGNARSSKSIQQTQIAIEESRAGQISHSKL
jgi:hypothetical protein